MRVFATVMRMERGEDPSEKVTRERATINRVTRAVLLFFRAPFRVQEPHFHLPS